MSAVPGQFVSHADCRFVQFHSLHSFGLTRRTRSRRAESTRVSSRQWQQPRSLLTPRASLEYSPTCREERPLPSLTIENYVKTIYQTCAAQGERAAATGQLAAALGVSPGTVTSMLKTLSDTGLARVHAL